MPRQLVISNVPVHVSLVEFDLDAGEDVFLTYVWERREGPEIRRTGQGPPFMDLIGGAPGQTTTHPFGLRLGTWLIEAALHQEELEQARVEIGRARSRRTPEEDRIVLDWTVDELQTPVAHDAIFQSRYPGLEIVGHQGCGDLTMNAWNVAYVNNALADPTPALVCLPDEPLESRTYSCLVKWRATAWGAGRVTIEELRFHRLSQAGEANKMVWVRFGGAWIPRGDSIEFAVSNQQVIRDGVIVPAPDVCHQFGDLRHLIQMPNLNPDGPLFPEERAAPGGRYRPRHYFGADQFGDVWFGEAAFLDATRSAAERRNLLRAALSGPVLLDLPPGANQRALRGALELAGYREVESALASLAPGDWRFVVMRPRLSVVEIYFKRNTYAWTMIGLSADDRRVLCLACTGQPGQTGDVLEDAARRLLDAGARQALLMDEGADVFQKVRWPGGGLIDMVPRHRQRVRATFIFAVPRYGLGARPSPGGSDEPPLTPPRHDLPPAVDRRPQMRPVRDQRQRPTCVGFAAAALRESMIEASPVLSPGFVYRLCKTLDGNPGQPGTHPHVALRLLRDQGVCPEPVWPYDAIDGPCPPDSKAAAAPFRVSGFVRLHDLDPAILLRNMKYWLYGHGVILAVVRVLEGWCMQRATGTGEIPDPARPERRLGWHAVCVVGFDERRFCFKNSWSTEWGDEGYGYLSYGYASAHCVEAWGIRPGRHREEHER